MVSTQIQQLNNQTNDAIAIGFDIETGGRTCSFFNTTSVVPKGFISETTNNFFDGEVHFGFNIYRTFQLR